MKTKWTILILLTFFLIFPVSGYSQMSNMLENTSIKAQRGQSEEQKKNDSYKCAEVSKEQLQKLKNEQQGDTNQGPKHMAGRSAAMGAAMGSIGGSFYGYPGRGAMLGAARGGIRGAIMEKRMKKKEAAGQKKAAQNAFMIAFSTCMQEKGYTVNY